jgi:hypothetical protein
MKKPLDPFDVLGWLNPIDTEQLKDAQSSPEAITALERIVSSTRQPRGTRRLPFLRRRRAAVLALAMVAVVLAATAWALTHNATKQLTIGCYESASLQADTVVIARTEMTPAAACREVWERGEFGRPVAQLEACVLPTGAVGVFPSEGRSACQALGLAALTPAQPAPSPTAPETGVEPRALKDALTDTFLASGCLDRRQAVVAVERVLARLGASEWTVRPSGTFTTMRRCASLAFDEENRVVLLVPMPPP